MKLIHSVKRLIQKFFPTFAINWRVNNYIKNKYHDKICGGFRLDEQIEENISIFLDETKLADKAYLEQIKKDIVKSYLLYGTNANEYFTLEFEKKGHKSRNEYLSKKRKNDLCIQNIKKLSAGKKWESIFSNIMDKNKFYSMSKDFFLRDATPVENQNDLNSFLLFIKKHPKFIAKPSRGGGGKGVSIVETSATSPEKAFDNLLKDGCYIAEELIVQDPRIAVFNESSINTVRVPSIMTDSGIHVFYPLFRVGRKGSIVDNASSGGTFASIDADTGVVITDGYDELGHYFAEHPDSHIIYKGFQIPEWKNLIATVNKIHSTMPKELKYIGFDFALSCKGWCVIEANWGEFVMQQKALGRGLYKEFKEALERG